ncbi:hypothetical protein AT5G66053 [Arabidopsis thaliana]|uniref:Uncharacterized protein n=1 Tax=Arabidopsis thaliana TaxID=3702 RepID=B3H5B2_ARATH|nr:uncharacterized protein AT5G66053 [Arabidopsis thaliana]AED98150.1 hypothetical protein AT5G66053 [Arabidopsis thaliana]|eukprot:NP_001119507.1 hypothetical protein AT5G66053 [Arabidopsis thaliana]
MLQRTCLTIRMRTRVIPPTSIAQRAQLRSIDHRRKTYPNNEILFLLTG